MAVHGTTRSKELVTPSHKFGIGLSYQDTLYLETAWAISELDEVNADFGYIFLEYGYANIWKFKSF